MPLNPFPRLAFGAFGAGVLLVAIFATLVLRFRTELRTEITEKMIGRDAAILIPVAMKQIENARAQAPAGTGDRSLLLALLGARQEGVLAMAIFDSDGAPIEYVPANQLFAFELPTEDFIQLLGGEPISRFYPEFPLESLFTGVGPGQEKPPVLEILLPLRQRGGAGVIGFARYHLDARTLAGELALIDARIRRHTTGTLLIGLGLIAAVVAAAAIGLHRAHRIIAERNERLVRKNFELTLSAKASALGQITSHLIHGLQGPVAGLRAAVTSGGHSDWQTAAAYTDRLQTLIHETVGLLGDSHSQATYELSGHELVDTIRAHSAARAAAKGIRFSVLDHFHHQLDSHRGSLLCLIATNLVENALDATPAGRAIDVSLNNGDGHLTVLVADGGPGMPETIRSRLFEPGHSTKPGGSGLGLAISQLLARQIGGELSLLRSDDSGTTFQLRLPLS